MSDFARADIANLTAGAECNRRTFAAAIAMLVPWPETTWRDRLRRFLRIPNSLPAGFPVYADTYTTPMDVPDLSNDDNLTYTRALATACLLSYSGGDSALTICKAIVTRAFDFLGMDVEDS